MRISIPPLEISDDEGFDSGKDLFGLKSFGVGMTNLVSSFEDPLVIAFDGQWGSGKTTFLKMWSGELRKLGNPTIYFDAFENDYVEDPFAALVREVTALIDSRASASKQVSENFKEKAIGLGKLIAKAGVKIGVRVAVRAASAGLASTSDVGDVIEEITDASSDVAEAYMAEMLAEPNKQKETVQSFREILSGLPANLAPPDEGKKQKPLVFIIDELDRCKPLFALELLERVKHFMAVPNVHFVFGVHLEQLINSVRIAYGSQIDAETYLQKFINITVSNVDTAEHLSQRRLTKFVSYLRKAHGFVAKDSSLLEYVENIVKTVAFKNNYSLRTVERIFSHIALCFAFIGPNDFRPGPLIAGLCILKVVAPKLYAKAKAGDLRYEEVAPILGFDNPPKERADQQDKREQLWWQFCLLQSPPKDMPQFGETLSKHDIDSRDRVLPHIANYVVDRLHPSS